MGNIKIVFVHNAKYIVKYFRLSKVFVLKKDQNIKNLGNNLCRKRQGIYQ